MRIRTLLLGLCFLLAACGGQAGPGPGPVAEEGGPVTESEGSATIELGAGPKKPIGTFTYRESKATAQIGTYCWTIQCVDVIGPPTPEVFTPVPAQLDIEFTGAGAVGSLDVGVPPKKPFAPAKNRRRIPIEENHATLNLDPGRYMLEIFAVWEEGDAVLTFGIEVV
jgi:hypothetical protein